MSAATLSAWAQRCELIAYRVYFLDGLNRFTRYEIVEAPSDQEAIELARPLARDALQFEVWDRDRLVKIVAPKAEN